MLKHMLSPTSVGTAPHNNLAWLDLEQIAQVYVTSEDPDYPVESVFRFTDGPGWRAGGKGMQTIRLTFDHALQLKRIRLRFEAGSDRTQEFTLLWSANSDDPGQEIVRQQWNFSAHGSSEIEDYRVELNRVLLLELRINPDLTKGEAVATLADWRVAGTSGSV
jgi:hypothetical protein